MALRIIHNVPAEEVDFIIQLMTDGGAKSATSQEEDDGEFTITAIFPDVEKYVQLRKRLDEA
jgi:hypothetical protein